MGLFTENIHFMKSKIFNYPNENVKWLMSSMSDPSAKFMKLSPEYLKIGSFFFLKYDMQSINKSSKMEQFIPMMVVDYKEKIDSKVVWILNMNFLTLKSKELFFIGFLDRYENIFMNNNEKTKWLEEQSLPGISYKYMYSELLKYGVEYSIREIRIDLINEIYGVSTDDVHKLVTMNTQAITGVDEAKLEEIWITKLKKERLEDRVVDIMTIKNNYDKIVEELAEKFKHLNKKIKE